MTVGAAARHGRNLAALLAGEAVQKIIALLLFMALSRWLTIEENGRYGLFTAVFPLMVVFLNMGFYDVAVRDIAQHPDRAGALVVNDPAGLRDHNEKLAALEFADCCPPTLVSRKASEIKAFVAEHGDAVLKPLDGMGGRWRAGGRRVAGAGAAFRRCFRPLPGGGFHGCGRR